MAQALTEGQREALEAVEQHGSIRAAARALGVNYSSLHERYNAAKRKQGLDPAIAGRLAELGVSDLGGVRGGWLELRDEEGKKAGNLQISFPKEEVSPEAIAERVRATLEGMETAALVPPPEYADADLCTAVLISDAHIGLQSWAKETGEAYNTDLAADRVKSWVGQVIAASPPSGLCVILDNGDLTHADDHTNMTPASKHVLDVDTRHFRTLDVTVETLARAIELALAKHQRVLVRILPGNHNRESYITILFALAERFRDNPRVTVQKVPGEFFAFEWGKVMLAAHHGDKAKADRLVHFLADQFAGMWGRTRHRFLFTGHLHHHKSQDIGGVQWEQLRAVTARDAYAVAHGYTARAQLQAITFHKERGEVQRVKVNA